MLLNVTLHPPKPPLAVQVGKLTTTPQFAVQGPLARWDALRAYLKLTEAASALPASASGLLLLFWRGFSAAKRLPWADHPSTSRTSFIDLANMYTCASASTSF
jgi:hypothetical protein